MGRRVGNVTERQVEGGAQAGGSPGVQGVQPGAFVGEFGYQVGDRPAGVGGQAGGGDPQGERQPAAEFGQPFGGLRFGGHPGAAEQLLQQAVGGRAG
ncbi:hypothetical protein GCM10009639_24020 [Kitasatospora putterlickiae]|uniref:Uncharacterized protein n=1 Tax=Kitasatospora putterlickiae TaxID=221725 RepID=A0ABN1XXG3_9ACTN